jgi:MFS family permease
MPDTSTPTATTESAAGYIDVLKWMLGLSAGVIAGVFLHPEQIAQASGWGKGAVVVVLALFGLSVIVGVVYLFWLSRVRRIKERLAEIKTELSTPVVTPDAKRTKGLVDEQAELTTENVEAKKDMNEWFTLLLWFFFGAAGIGLIVFCVFVGMLKPPEKAKDPPPPPPAVEPLKYTVVQSAVHSTKGGMQAHTFLLNQQTGEMWQMMCDAQGKVVSFQRVLKRDLKGNPEPDDQ